MRNYYTFALFSMPIAVICVNVMSMIDGVDIQYNSYLEILNMNEATNRYLDERADISQILTVDIVIYFLTHNLFISDDNKLKLRI